MLEHLPSSDLEGSCRFGVGSFGQAAVILLLYKSAAQMNLEQEYIVTLTRLQLPEGTAVGKMTLSLLSNGEEHFIQSCRLVKNWRVNFYRESLFVSSISQGLTFRIYRVTEDGEAHLVKGLRVSGEELSSVRKRAAMLHSSSDGFELVWECATFNSSESELENQETDKEYTELQEDLIDGETQLQEHFIATHSNVEVSNSNSLDEDLEFRESSSTDETYQPKSPEEKHWRLKEDFQIAATSDSMNGVWLKRFQSEAGSTPYKKKANIKSQIYSQLLLGITELFAGVKG